MHDLQTIIKLNAPVSQRTLALAKAHQIEREALGEVFETPVPILDRVDYGSPPQQFEFVI